MVVTDQLNRRIEVPGAVRRIVSLVPSITLTLFDLGLDEAIAGRTKFCIHPKESVETVPRIGGTKNFHIDRIEALNPDLVIANKEENDKDRIETLAKKYPVYISDVRDLESNYRMIRDLGRLTGTTTAAEALIEDTEREFETVTPETRRSAAYFIWKDPYMVAGDDTFIHSMLSRIGLENVFASKTGRYPTLTEEEIRQAAPRIMLLSSEPYPFKEKHLESFRAICPDAEVKVVDGEYFSWYGSRLKESPAYFRKLL